MASPCALLPEIRVDAAEADLRQGVKRDGKSHKTGAGEILIRHPNIEIDVPVPYRKAGGVLLASQIPGIESHHPEARRSPGFGDVQELPSLRQVSQEGPEVDSAAS